MPPEIVNGFIIINWVIFNTFFMTTVIFMKFGTRLLKGLGCVLGIMALIVASKMQCAQSREQHQNVFSHKAFETSWVHYAAVFILHGVGLGVPIVLAHAQSQKRKPK